MIGGITAGFCLREWILWYGDKPPTKPCPIPLSDGKVCGDFHQCERGRDYSKNRCPYESKLKVDMTGQKYTTYAYLNDPKGKSPGVMATGGAG